MFDIDESLVPKLRFLSRAFLYPDRDWLAWLREPGPDSVEAWRRELAGAFANLAPHDLQTEYTRLFINGYPRALCLPCESVYLEGRMFGNASAEVRAIYRAWGVEVEPRMMDHLSSELEFLAFLLAAADVPRLSANARAEAKRFLEEHLLLWVPGFVSDLAQHTELEGYRTLAKLLQETVVERAPV